MSDIAPSAPWDNPRFDKVWGTRAQVYAAWKAGWDITQGPPPEGADAHGLPPEHTVTATGPHGEFKHNGIEPTDAEPLFPDQPSTQTGAGE